MSTPITLPPGPTFSEARKLSIPPPEPRSRTVSPSWRAACETGLPDPNPRSAPSGICPNCSSLYPIADEVDVSLVSPQQDGPQQLPLASSAFSAILP